MKITDKPKNPLRLVLILLVFFELLGVISLCRLLMTSGFQYIIKEKPNLLVFLLITILFVYCYIKKTIWAFWVAVFVYPIVTIFVYLHNSLAKQEWIYLIIINVVIFGYLCSKLEDYENFVKYHGNKRERCDISENE